LLRKKLNYLPKFRFFRKISIFVQNFNFCSKFEFFFKISIFHHNFNFSSIISIVHQNFNVSPKFEFFNFHNSIFSPKYQFLSKISIFLQNYLFSTLVGIWFHSDSTTMHISSAINGHSNYNVINSAAIPIDEWTRVDITQFKQPDKSQS